MKKKICYVIILILFISLKTIYSNDIKTVKGEEQTLDIKVILQGEDEVPSIQEIGKIGPLEESIELWHYSGGYWKYGDIVIYDNNLDDYINDPVELGEALNQEITFEIPIDQALYETIKELEEVTILCSTTLEDKSITDLFYGKPNIEISNQTIYFKGNPKFHFYSGDNVTFETFLDEGTLNQTIPIVDPDYGYNTYAIWRRDRAVDWGRAEGYFNKEDVYAPAPENSGKIAPSQIKNAAGHLRDGFTIRARTTMRPSEESSVGYNTFSNAGAVGMHFKYPIELTFYGSATKDLSAEFETLPRSAASGEEVLVGIKIESTFEETVKNVEYNWTIQTKESNTYIEEVSIEGLDTTQEVQGTIDTLSPQEEKIIYARFTMPEEDVDIRFSINEEGTHPEEINLENNIAKSGEAIKVVETLEPVIGAYDIDYNILSRDIRYPLSETNIEANLGSAPRGIWIGHATGNLEVRDISQNTIDTSLKVLNNFKVTNNPTVNEPATRIVRRPVIEATLRRKDFGDNPQESNYLNLIDPRQAQIQEGRVNYRGNVSRRYQYTVWVGEGYSTRTRSTSASFNPGENIKTIKTYVYNGQETIPDKHYTNAIENNANHSTTKTLRWRSEPYTMQVIRWMAHMDQNDTLYNWTKIDGQYQRKFTQQNSGQINWAVKESIKKGYNNSREAARNRNYTQEAYDKGVFASDRDYRNVAYPIKSGYYLNPTGEYTFTIETTTYKPTSADTQDHKDLVNEVINAFRYETNLIYINNNQEAVNLQNERLARRGNSYQERPASITAQNATGVNGIKLLEVIERNQEPSRYTKTVEELEHSEEETGYTHQYYKNILEGYEESGTIESLEDYKYQEYIKAGQTMYKITEQTKVTIKINPQNRKIYTHAHMPNGRYYIKAWIGDIDLSKTNNEYKKLGLIRGINTLDEIEITVVGSIYDDIY
ncbi:hypothetical protein EDC19_0105 [Natranaerovirga hydrolytica]|uniref:Uncharacterized protein n=1 Tax=Natranaerovirga hydrolytica TaxID=680378 RepID=A0A4R1N105_9FIRM|nr:hypothetical protein [Natranaerovirga hydrolytica]TCK99485.1 hypothetical protein EDC19_0105 [Natranaerovirga hydrolytica]